MSDRYEDRDESRNILKELAGWIFYFIVIIGLTYIIVTYVGQRTRVDGSSMETTLSDGDHLLVDKISYRFSEPERYDIIVFPYLHEEKVYYIKRIIGLPGETVQVIDGYVYVNGKMLDSDIYGAEIMEDAEMAADPLTLGEDEYFVLGDNRNHSADSRDPSVGLIKRKNIMGKAWVRVYPFDQMGKIKHTAAVY